ncbi:BZIP domain-containing protein [Mycena kentingensis (nom. inval.)]|nr:BZIP domain-containing protein [Mycena kentingensis (nom. inval.)]
MAAEVESESHSELRRADADRETRARVAFPNANAERESQKTKTTTRRARPTLLEQLNEGNTHVLGDTLDLSTLSFEDVAGTCITPDNLLDALCIQQTAAHPEPVNPQIRGYIHCGVGDIDALYHLFVAVRTVVENSNEYPKAGYLLPTEAAGPENKPVPSNRLVQDILEQFLVEICVAVNDRAYGPMMVFVDPRRHANAGGMVRSVRRMLAKLVGRGVERNHIAFSIPATEDGVRAAQTLAAARIKTNLILVSGLMHAAVCVESRASAISISVQALLEAREKRYKNTYPDLAAHPGVEEIQTIIEYFRFNNLETRLLGVDFRELAELGTLPGFDAVALNAKQLTDIRWRRSRSRQATSPNPTAALRARQAQFPTQILSNVSQNQGCFRGLSAPSRNQIFETLYPALRHMEDAMRAIEMLIRAQLTREITQRTMSLTGLLILADEEERRHRPMLAEIMVPNEVPGREQQREKTYIGKVGGLRAGVDYF